MRKLSLGNLEKLGDLFGKCPENPALTTLRSIDLIDCNVFSPLLLKSRAKSDLYCAILTPDFKEAPTYTKKQLIESDLGKEKIQHL